MSLGSLGFIGFIRARLGGGSVTFVTLGWFGRILVVVVFIWAHIRFYLGSLGLFERVLLGTQLGSSGSFGFAGLIRARPGVRRVYSGSFGSFRRSLGVVGVLWARWVHLYAAWRSSGSFGFVVFNRGRPGGRWVHSSAASVWLGSFECSCGRFHSGSLG